MATPYLAQQSTPASSDSVCPLFLEYRMSVQSPDRRSAPASLPAQDLDPRASAAIGATTRVGDASLADSQTAEAAGGALAPRDPGDPALIATSGTLVAGLLPDSPEEVVRRWLERGVRELADRLVRMLIEGSIDLAIAAMEHAQRTVTGFIDNLQRSIEGAFGLRRLTGAEISASQSVHGSSLIDYDPVRVIPSSWFTKLSQMRAFVTFNIIHYPNDHLSLDTCCHELTHVAQYQAIGARYIPEAIHAQHTGGYSYGNLGTARTQGKTFRDFNREQQAQIALDYYRVVVSNQSPSSSGSGSAADYTHFIQQMRSGSYW